MIQPVALFGARSGASRTATRTREERMYTVTYTSQGGTLRIEQRFWTKRGAKKFVRVLAESGRKGRIS